MASIWRNISTLAEACCGDAARASMNIEAASASVIVLFMGTPPLGIGASVIGGAGCETSEELQVQRH
jgi:hypothetical protein